jgi:hypothetical protein
VDGKRGSGAEHPDALGTAANLATALVGEGGDANLQEAAILFRQTLVVMKRVLGREHPDALRTARNLRQLVQTLH